MKKFFRFYQNLSQGVKASFWFAFSSLLQKGFALIATPFYTRFLTTDEYGFFSVYNSWLSIITIFATLNLSAGVLNNLLVNKEEFHCDDNKIVSNIQFLEIILITFVSAIILLLKVFIPSIFSIPLSAIVAICITVFFTSAVSLWSVKEKFRYRFRAVVFVSLLSSVLTICLNLIFIKYGNEKRMALVFGSTISCIVVYFFLIAIDDNNYLIIST